MIVTSIFLAAFKLANSPFVLKLVLKVCFLNVNVVFDKGSVHNIASQPCLKNGKKSADNGNTIAVLLTDLTKAFDCVRHDLIVAKLNVYGLSFSLVRLIHSYLSDRKKKTKINSSYSLNIYISLVSYRVLSLGALIQHFYLKFSLSCE